MIWAGAPSCWPWPIYNNINTKIFRGKVQTQDEIRHRHCLWCGKTHIKFISFLPLLFTQWCSSRTVTSTAAWRAMCFAGPLFSVDNPPFDDPRSSPTSVTLKGSLSKEVDGPLAERNKWKNLKQRTQWFWYKIQDRFVPSEHVSHLFTLKFICCPYDENIVDADRERWFADTKLGHPGGGGGVLLGILGGGVAPGSPSLTRFQTKKCNFPHPFSDQTFKIHTRFQIWPLGRSYVMVT